jgi:hypothetical protein
MDELAAVGIKAVGGPSDKGQAVDFSGDPHMEVDKEVRSTS